jgi:hypothetical protein
MHFISVILRPDVGPELVEWISRDASDLIATSWLFGEHLRPKSHEAAIQFDIFREVLRPPRRTQDDKLK